MSDDRNFLEKAQSISKKRIGREISPKELATEFSKWGIEQRINYLDDIESDLKRTQFSSEQVREAAKLQNFVSALNNTHERLRKIGR
jgi:hypothetical protein